VDDGRENLSRPFVILFEIWARNGRIGSVAAPTKITPGTRGGDNVLIRHVSLNLSTNFHLRGCQEGGS
jgi:hypothetical protein